eukprot:922520-Alexandrium_andersonii.AAC.1
MVLRIEIRALNGALHLAKDRLAVAPHEATLDAQGHGAPHWRAGGKGRRTPPLRYCHCAGL